MANPYGITEVDVPGLLAGYQNTQNNRLQRLQAERQMRREDQLLQREESQLKSYGDFVRKGGLGKAYSPEQNEQFAQMGPQMGTQMAGAARQATEQRRADLPFMRRLLDSVQDENSYAQARTIAQEYGIDLTGAPETYDPAWVDRQRTLVTMMSSGIGQEILSNAGKQAYDMGYRPGTPEYQNAVGIIVENELAQQVTLPSGEIAISTPTIRTSGGTGRPPPISEGATATNPQTGEQIIYRNGNWQPVMSNAQGGRVLNSAVSSQRITADEAARIRQSMGPNGQRAFENWARENNILIEG